MPVIADEKRFVLSLIDDCLALIDKKKSFANKDVSDEPRADDGKWTSGGGPSGSSKKKTPRQIRNKASYASKTHPRELRRRLRTLQDVHERVIGRLAKSKIETHGKILALHDQWNASDSPEKKNKIRDKLIKQNDKFAQVENEIATRQKNLVERARKIVEVPASSRSKNKYQADSEDLGKREDVHEGVKIFDRYASRDIDIPETVAIKDGGARAHYAGKVFNENAVYVDNSKKPTDFIHEMGHAIEDHHPAIMRESVDFLSRRTMNDKTRELNDIYSEKYGQKISSFGKEEVSKADKFHDPYVGKQYVAADGKHYATEVLSMGIERLHADPIEFQKNDPDYFDHVLNCLRGRYK